MKGKKSSGDGLKNQNIPKHSICRANCKVEIFTWNGSMNDIDIAFSKGM